MITMNTFTVCLQMELRIIVENTYRVLMNGQNRKILAAKTANNANTSFSVVLFPFNERRYIWPINGNFISVF